jgi:peptide deformylase
VDPTSSGTARPITVMGAPVLAEPCAEVTVFDDALATLVADMFASMYDAGGVGLAANQIGVGLRVFVIDCPFVRGEEGAERLVGHVVNPVLRILDDTPHDGGEGCLSVPGPRADLPRASVAEVTGVDVEGNPVRLEGSGLAARCLQHESDHLDGRLYVSRLSRAEQVRVTEEFQAERLARSPFARPAP